MATEQVEVTNDQSHIRKKNYKPSPVARILRNIQTTFKKITVDDLTPDDVIIAVMGPTGAGKSTFISKILGQDLGIIGHDLQSETSEVDIYRMSAPDIVDGTIVFVDTPGFDDTRRSDLDILKLVADWLKSTYEKNILLSGILYMHRISDNRMAGTLLRTLRAFEQLVGKQSLHNVMLVTTMWDEVDDELGSSRETELVNNYWKYMISRGSGTGRFLGTREAGLALMQPLMDKANERHALRLQKELVKLKRELPETTVGQELFSKLEFVLKERQDAVNRYREAARQGQDNVDQYRAEWDAAEAKVNAVMKDMQALKLPLLQRVITSFRAWFVR